ncbi:asparaginase [Klugiella xanthotipulae]|uniref:asparaginase n=1 Tax=Klugiella xanthotipulae TaxID=244735 RepID=A0A543HYG2_9MICO|nr:asparaginase [Klugiella xanthotipulae]TQM63285.1 L-asparaginase [Klugiella xanthotipulae]
MAHIEVLGTGGTIASRSRGTAGAVAEASAAELLAHLGGDHVVSHRDILTVGSYQLTLKDLRLIAQAVAESARNPEVDGIVVTHGTDTLEETAFLLDLVHSSAKPVVVTGAQRTADSDAPDGPGNIAEAIAVAADPSMRGLGALIAFSGTVRTARGARKSHTVAAAPFTGGTEVGHFAGGRLVATASTIHRLPLDAPTEAFDTTVVDVVSTYPGAEPVLLTAALDRASAVIIAGTGVGNAGPGFAEAISASTRPIILSTRVPWGPVVPTYGNGGGIDLVAAGAVPSGDLNPYQSRILAALLVSQGYHGAAFAERFARQL